MEIRELAQRAGVPAKTIRYYESIGILPKPARGANNYRQYGERDLERLQFVAGTRTLGFGLQEIGTFLVARDQNKLQCRSMAQALDDRIAELDRKILALRQLRASLVSLSQSASTLAEGRPCGPGCAQDLSRATNTLILEEKDT